MLVLNILRIKKLSLKTEVICISATVLKSTIQEGDKKVLIVFDAMITDKISKKKLHRRVTGLLIRGRNLTVSLVFISQKINTTHYFIIKIPNRREIQQISINHSSDVDLEDFLKL